LPNNGCSRPPTETSIMAGHCWGAQVCITLPFYRSRELVVVQTKLTVVPCPPVLQVESKPRHAFNVPALLNETQKQCHYTFLRCLYAQSCEELGIIVINMPFLGFRNSTVDTIFEKTFLMSFTPQPSTAIEPQFLVSPRFRPNADGGYMDKSGSLLYLHVPSARFLRVPGVYVVSSYQALSAGLLWFGNGYGENIGGGGSRRSACMGVVLDLTRRLACLGWSYMITSSPAV
jgi:hypothetical protein